jgi:Flp pilus assembly pilin Flp
MINAIKSMLSDESGAAIYEYAVVLSLFSVVALLALTAYCTVASNTVNNNIQQMSQYSSDPTYYECQANGGSSC